MTKKATEQEWVAHYEILGASEMSKIEEAMEGYWGKRCPDYEQDCLACKAWDEYEDMMVLLEDYKENYKEMEV
jgi:hypothetical protein